MNIAPGERVGHAYANIEHRRRKAAKLRHLLETQRPLAGNRVLEIGTGAGVIIQTLSAAIGPSGHAVGVDIVDQRRVHDGFDFLVIQGTALPFADHSFDLVVSNHVIEHVGPTPAQLDHLREIRRVLRPDGIGYLAVPNRWRWREPHFSLPLLSWLPRPLADHYVRRTRRGTHYDCWPPGPRTLRRMLQAAGLSGQNLCPAAVRYQASATPDRLSSKAILALPAAALLPLTSLMPTLIVLLRPQA